MASKKSKTGVKFESDWTPPNAAETPSSDTSFDDAMTKLDQIDGNEAGGDSSFALDTDGRSSESSPKASADSFSDGISESSDSNSDDRRSLKDPEIDKYRRELEDDLRLTHADGSVDLTAFKTKTFMEAATRGKWLAYLYKEKEILVALKDKIAEFNGAVTAKIMSAPGSGFEKQQRVTAFMKGNATVAKLNSALKSQQSKIDFLTEANEIMSKFGYSIRNGIDYLKLHFS